MKIKFICPKCKCAKIEEVMGDVTVSSSVNGQASLVGGELCLEYDNSSNEGGEVERYQCMVCGKNLGSTSDELLAFLKENNMIELEEGDEQE